MKYVLLITTFAYLLAKTILQFRLDDTIVLLESSTITACIHCEKTESDESHTTCLDAPLSTIISADFLVSISSFESVLEFGLCRTENAFQEGFLPLMCFDIFFSLFDRILIALFLVHSRSRFWQSLAKWPFLLQ